jgi:hypothetical protein
VDLNAYLNVVDMPDNREGYVRAYGSQDITAFLTLTGAITNVGEADEVTSWEETRLHPVQEVNLSATAATALTRVYTSSGNVKVRANDVVILDDGESRAFVTAVTATGFTVASFDGDGLPAISATSATAVKHKIVGNMYAQGTDQPSEFFTSNIRKRTNPFMIIKDIYKVTGSQATNKAWITHNGQRYYYLKAQEDFNKRFKNWRETMLLLGKLVEGTATGNISNIDGSEGYFSAVEEGGIVSPTLSTLTAVDNLIDEFDVQGAASDEYMMFLNRTESLNIDDMLAAGLATGALNNGLPSQFGVFNNSQDMAVNLGFKSFTRGDRTFHKQGWKLLNEETLLKDTDFKGAVIPTGMQVDGKSGKYCPPLEMNYKSAPNENRLMKSWLTGSILGATNQTADTGQFNYLSEVNLVTRARNQHSLIKY